ncbi:MAG: nuclear transport factor 2 family protein [Roseiflexaceae bacterium]
MYHMIVKRQVRRGFRHLSAGDYEAVLRQFASKVQFTFAGNHALSGDRDSVEAVRQWFQSLYRFFPGLRFEIHDVVVNGWPWNTVVATRFSIQASLRDGRLYRNAGMQYARLRWGRIVEDHIYEDTQTLALELQQMAHQGISEAVVLPTSAR